MYINHNSYSYSWFKLALFSIGVGAYFALILGLSRTPIGHILFPLDYFHYALIGHVNLVLICWLLAFTVYLWGVYLKGGYFKYSCLISGVGVILIIGSVTSAKGSPLTNNYAPILINPHFFAGMGFFIFGFAIEVISYIRNAFRHFKSNKVVLHLVFISVIIASLIISAIITSLIKFNPESYSETMYYEYFFWSPGHIHQILNGVVFLIVLYTLTTILNVKVTFNKYLIYANYVFVIAAIIFFLTPIFFSFKLFNIRLISEIIYGISLGIPVAIHAYFLLMKIKEVSYKKEIKQSIAYKSIVYSMTIYFFGVIIAYFGIGDDLRLPAHYHGTVASLTLALMGYSYYVVKSHGILIVGKKIAHIQPAIFGVGMFMVMIGLYIPGLFGAPRKVPCVGYTDDPIVLFFLIILGIGTVLAVIGIWLFVSYILLSYLKHLRSENRDYTTDNSI